MGWLDKLFGGRKQEESSGMGSSMHMAAHSAAGAKTAKDPVCGMDVDMDKAVATYTYQGQTYYFCAPGCKKAFEQDPAKFVTGKREMHGGHMR